MEQTSEIREAIGFWYGAQVLCPWCFERQGRVPHEGVIPPDDLVGLLTKCAVCKIPLWKFQEMENDAEDLDQ